MQLDHIAIRDLGILYIIMYLYTCISSSVDVRIYMYTQAFVYCLGICLYYGHAPLGMLKNVYHIYS